MAESTLIGIIPAAGKATRMHGIPKYLLPVGNTTLKNKLDTEMFAAGAHNTYFITPEIVPNSHTLCQTVLSVKHLCLEANVLFAMPDTYFTDDGGYALLRLRQFFDRNPEAIAAAACWRARPDQDGKLGIVAFDEDLLEITAIEDKAEILEGDEAWAWGAIIWRPAFWEYIKPEQATIGDALKEAMDACETVLALPIEGEYWDCGTPEEYFRLVSEHAEQWGA